MDVKQITLEFLKSNGYDGLYQDTDGGCACKLDDLFPCAYAGVESCRPGYLQKPGPDSEYDFFICKEKPPSAGAPAPL